MGASWRGEWCRNVVITPYNSYLSNMHVYGTGTEYNLIPSPRVNPCQEAPAAINISRASVSIFGVFWSQCHSRSQSSDHHSRSDSVYYSNDILSWFDCAPIHTPLTVKDKLSSSQSPSTNEEQRQILGAFKNLNYLEGVGSLLYACQTRLDIAHATGKPHYDALKCVLRYLKGTAHFGLTFGGSDNKTDWIGWSDADWAQDTDTRRLQHCHSVY